MNIWPKARKVSDNQNDQRGSNKDFGEHMYLWNEDDMLFQSTHSAILEEMIPEQGSDGQKST